MCRHRYIYILFIIFFQWMMNKWKNEKDSKARWMMFWIPAVWPPSGDLGRPGPSQYLGFLICKWGWSCFYFLGIGRNKQFHLSIFRIMPGTQQVLDTCKILLLQQSSDGRTEVTRTRVGYLGARWWGGNWRQGGRRKDTMEKNVWTQSWCFSTEQC